MRGLKLALVLASTVFSRAGRCGDDGLRKLRWLLPNIRYTLQGLPTGGIFALAGRLLLGATWRLR